MCPLPGKLVSARRVIYILHDSAILRQQDTRSAKWMPSIIKRLAELAHDVGPSFAMILDLGGGQSPMRERQVRAVPVRLELDRDDARLKVGVRRNPGE